MRNFQKVRFLKIMFITGLEAIWRADIMFVTNLLISLCNGDVLKNLLRDKRKKINNPPHVNTLMLLI